MFPFQMGISQLSKSKRANLESSLQVCSFEYTLICQHTQEPLISHIPEKRILSTYYQVSRVMKRPVLIKQYYDNNQLPYDGFNQFVTIFELERKNRRRKEMVTN